MVTVGADGRYACQSTVLVVFWPAPQHDALVRRGPYLAQRVGATWDEHGRRIERHCMLAERDAGMSVNPVPADLPSFEACLNRRRVTAPSVDGPGRLPRPFAVA